MRHLLTILALSALLLAGCSRSAKEIRITVHPTEQAAFDAAKAEADAIGGWAAARSGRSNDWHGNGLGRTGYWVVDTAHPFEQLKVGNMVVFAGSTALGRPPLIAHRLVSGNPRKGFRAAGDGNRFMDPEIITAQSYIGRVASVHRWEGGA